MAGNATVGGLVDLTPIDPVRAPFWTAVTSGVVAVPGMVSTVLLAAQPAVMAAAAAAMFATL